MSKIISFLVSLYDYLISKNQFMRKLLLALFLAFGLQTQAQLWSIQLDVDPIAAFSPATGLAGSVPENWMEKLEHNWP